MDDRIGPAAARQRALAAAGLIHPHPDLVTAVLFDGREPFFLTADKVQVKYEMLRAHVVDGASVTTAAESHGYSRAGFYLVEAAFEVRGMMGLLNERRGRKGPLKVTPEILEYLRQAGRAQSAANLVDEIERSFGVQLHRRTIERARRR